MYICALQVYQLMGFNCIRTEFYVHMPYLEVNCLTENVLDPIIRSHMELDLEGDIVIFDEAHNIEDSCRDSVTFSIPLDLLFSAESNFTHLG